MISRGRGREGRAYSFPQSSGRATKRCDGSSAWLITEWMFEKGAQEKFRRHRAGNGGVGKSR